MRIINILVFCVIVSVCVSGCFNDKKDVNTILSEAVVKAKNSDWKDVLKKANLVLKRENNNTNALILRMIAAKKLGDDALAIDSANLALKINPDNFIVLYSIGHLYSLDKARLSEAMKYLEKAHNLKPNDRNTIILLANLSVQLKSQKALSYLSKLSKLDGKIASTPQFSNLLGCAYWNAGLRKEASISFIKSFNSENTNPVFATNLAVAFEVFYKKKASDISYYKTALKYAKESPKYSDLANILEAKLQ